MPTIRKTLSTLFLVFLATVLISACSQDVTDNNIAQNENGANEGSGNTGSDSAVAQDLIVAMLSDAPSTDPHMSTDQTSSYIITHLYETLVIHDSNLEIQPGLAESWEQIDELTWEFNLRQGISFTDGSEFNAEAVKANIDRMLDPAVASPRAFLVDMISSVEVVDSHTVRIITEYPFSPLLSHLAHSGVSIVSPEAIAQDYAQMEAGDRAGTYLSANPAGTGMFVLDSWNPGQDLKLAANTNYWGEPAKLSSILFKVVPETATRIAELETGNAHIIDPIGPTDINYVEGLENAHVNFQPSLSLSYIGFNLNKAPFDDVRVRQAISMAIDKDEIIQGILEGVGIPAVGPLAPDVYGYDPSVSPIPYDQDRARELLAEAGYPDGFSTTIWTNDNAERIQMAEYVQSKLSELNISVQVEVVEWGAYLADTAAGQHDMFVLGWSTVTADADYGMYPLFHSANVGEPGNRSFLSDPELDEILEQARQESDESTRLALYKQAQEMLVDLAPMLYIHHKEDLNGVSNNVQGFWRHPNGILMLHDVYLTE